MDIRQWSQNSQAFKTISSESETRHQTSNKKYYSKPKAKCRGSSKHKADHMNIEQLQKLLNYMLVQRSKQAERKKYENVVELDRRIKHIKEKIMEEEQKFISQCDEEEQLEIYKVHEEEMRGFREKWEEIFEKFERKQNIMKLKLQVEEERQVRAVSQSFQKKVEEMDQKMMRNKQLLRLQRMQNDLSRRGKYQQLLKLNINEKKRDLKKQLVIQRNRTISEMQKKQQWKLKDKFNKKYDSLVSKIQQCKNLQMKIYNKHEKILKQRFLNAISKLQHEQNMRRSRCFSTIK